MICYANRNQFLLPANDIIQIFILVTKFFRKFLKFLVRFHSLVIHLDDSSISEVYLISKYTKNVIIVIWLKIFVISKYIHFFVRFFKCDGKFLRQCRNGELLQF